MINFRTNTDSDLIQLQKLPLRLDGDNVREARATELKKENVELRLDLVEARSR